MSDSIHTARWISQIADQNWDIHLFPSFDGGIGHTTLHNLTIHHSIYSSGNNPHGIRVRGIPVPINSVAYAARRVLEKIIPKYRELQLMYLIKRLKPDIIHSLEMQHAGYLVHDTKLRSGKETFPAWIMTTWGSDISLFGRLRCHVDRVKGVLSSCDYFESDCIRDNDLASSFGFTGSFLPVIPGGGGFDLQRCHELKLPGFASSRRVIMVKGYQGWSGRALVALRALARCTDILHGFKIVLYSVQADDVKISAELLGKHSGIDIEILPLRTPHEKLLALHGCARVSIGLGISDGLPNSLLEAMVMGSFPIQSFTACTDEWITDGVNGLLVPPEDPEIIEQALRKALLDDELVNQAAKRNSEIAAERLDQRVLRKKVVDFYKRVLEEHHIMNKHTA